jgi:hypothetical protein
MKKLLLFLILGIFMISLANAQIQTLGTFTVNKSVVLLQSCSNCTSINISSVYSPSGIIVVRNVAMTRNLTLFNYTLNSTLANEVGRWIVTGITNNDGINVNFAYDFYLNEGGSDITTPQGILYFIALALATFLFVLSLYFSITIPFKNTRDDDGRIVSVNKLKYLKLVLIALSYMLLLFIFGITKSITSSFLYISGVSNIFNIGYWLMLSALYPAIVLTFVGIIVFLFEDNILKKKIKRRNYR